MIHKKVQFEVKETHEEENLGIIEGWGNVFSEKTADGSWKPLVDRGGDMLAHGSMQPSPKKIPALFMHDESRPIGNAIAEEVTRDGKHGIWITMKLAIHSPNQTLRERAQYAFELFKNNIYTDMSIGFGVSDAEVVRQEKQRVRKINKLEIFEISQVMLGMNQQSRAVSVKQADLVQKYSGDYAAEYQKEVAEGVTMADLSEEISYMLLHPVASKYIAEISRRAEEVSGKSTSWNMDFVMKDGASREYFQDAVLAYFNDGGEKNYYVEKYLLDQISQFGGYDSLRPIN